MAPHEDDDDLGRDASLQEPLLNAELRSERLPIHTPDDVHQARDAGVTGYSTAGLWSLATLSWLNPLLALGYRKDLTESDIPHLQERGREIYSTFRQKWDSLGPAPSILVALVRNFWASVLVMGVLNTIMNVASFVGPYLIEDFVEFLGGRRRFRHEGVVLVVIFLTANVLQCMTQRHYSVAMFQFNARIRTCLTAVIYRKSLRLSSTSRKNRTSGEIINYLAVDVQRVIDAAWWVHDVWILPMQVVLSLGVLYTKVGFAPTMAALIATIATVLANIPISTLMENFEEKLMAAKDARMKTTSECLRNMRILKLQAWETDYMTRIEKLRGLEYNVLVKEIYLESASAFLLCTSPTIIAISTFGTCIALGVPLTPGRVLSALATFAILQQPLQYIPEFVALMVQSRVSLNRLWLFLQEPELPTDAVERTGSCESHDGVAIEVENGEFNWNAGEETSGPPTLRNVNLQIQKGSHVAVCGQVGSGKSALLACLLGEIPKVAGRVRVEGRTAYVAQTAWIQSGTFKDNISFGKRMDEALYERVLHACDLKKDIALLPFGDETVIGERGINLSGGQKQRVQLARALFQEADVYFLDDPFSAVDAHTGSHLLKECIVGLLASKTVVYVTHQMEFLHSADHILVLREGEIVQAGDHRDLLKTGTEFNTLFQAHNSAIEHMQLNASKRKGDTFLSNGENTKLLETSETWQIPDTDDESEEEPAIPQQLIKEEERETGSVSYQVYWAYITAVAGGAFIPVYILSQIIVEVLGIGSSYWLAWGSSSSGNVSEKQLISVYSLLGAIVTLFVLLTTFLATIIGYKAAQKYFSLMLRSIFSAPMSFFDSTPSGRITSRMSADQTSMDMSMPFAMTRVVTGVVALLGILFLMSQITWQIVIVVVPIACICVLYQRYFIASGRQLSRLVKTQRSPIINHYEESIAGATTIRGFHQEDRFMDKNLSNLDNYADIFFHKGAVGEWLTLRMEMLSVIAYSVFLMIIVAFPQGSISPSLAGVAITYGLSLSGALSGLLWNVAYLETTFVGFERILQYCKLPTEAPLVIETARPARNWPSKGTIDIHNLQVRYNAHSPLVLHGLTCTFEGGERVGIAGRTGSGKSTLILTLFRVVEPSGGRIVIDGLDVSTIGLHDLRSSLSIIPQDPTLFEGSIRVNLDPLGKYSDAEIWESLDKCQLGDIIRAKDEKLEASVSENGENWSVGQRQLVCLGRALLKQTRILVLDEATASVDSATDGLIQHTLQSEFRHCTVITVAHRIPTIIDSDKVLVLENGRVVEHNSPAELLRDSSSFFSKLVAEYSTKFTHK